MKAGSCTVCSHPQRAEIDSAAISGASIRTLAAQFGRNKDTIQKHVADHIPAAAQKALEASDARDVNAGDTTLADLRDLVNEAKRLQAKAEKKKDIRTAIAAFRELVRVVELKARILGEIHENEIKVSVYVDDATATRMAQTFLARRSKPAITVHAQPATTGIQPVAPLQVTENEGEK